MTGVCYKSLLAVDKYVRLMNIYWVQCQKFTLRNQQHIKRKNGNMSIKLSHKVTFQLQTDNEKQFLMIQITSLFNF